jgi:signal transduction histidine kinase
MSEMIQDLLASARLQTGRAQSVEVDLADLVRSKAVDFESVGSERDVEIEARPGHAEIHAVEIALDRALSNLVENAVKAAPPGSTVVIGSGVVGEWAWIGVRDSGPGLPEEPDERIGLGISIVTQIAEGHGGSLTSFQGEDGRGTTMVVW